MVFGEKDPVEFAVAYHAVRHIRVLHPPYPLESVLVLAEGSSEHHLLTVDDGVFLSAARCICEVVLISTNRDSSARRVSEETRGQEDSML